MEQEGETETALLSTHDNVAAVEQHQQQQQRQRQ